MKTDELIYRKVDSYNENDMKKLVEMMGLLNGYLKSTASPLTESQLDWLRIRMGNVDLLDKIVKNKDNTEYKNQLLKTPDEIAWFCEYNGEVIGYTHVCTYNIKNGERQNDDIGNISDIFVLEKYRKPSISYGLLTKAFETLIEAGKNRVCMNVQEDNSNRFLHFALADKIVKRYKCKRTDGSVTVGYELLVSDIKKIQQLSYWDIAKRALKVKKEFEQKNLKEPKSFKD